MPLWIRFFLSFVLIKYFCSIAVLLAPANAADAPELTACGIVTGGDAQKLVGGPLEVKESAKVPTAEGASSYTSTCSYLAKGGSFQEMLVAPRGLDITLHFLDTAAESAKLYENSLEQYSLRINSPNLPYTNATITPIGFADKAFLLEAVADAKTGYRSSLIVFYKGRVAGSVAAWNKPASSFETTQTVLKHILGKLR